MPIGRNRASSYVFLQNVHNRRFSMSKERIVLETTERRKAALVNALDLQGDTLAGWFEEQLTLSIPGIAHSRAPTPVSRCTISNLADPANLLKQLRAQDWSFTHDDTRYLTHDLHPYP